jgi:hypothetical protein
MPPLFDRVNTVWWFAALLRLVATQLAAVPVISNVSFSAAGKLSDTKVKLWPVEVHPHRLIADGGPTIQEESLVWIAKYWQDAAWLMNNSREFNLAMQTLARCGFERFYSLALLSLWSGLEAIFSPGSSELRFRVSSSIAAFLEEPGAARLELQKRVAELYDVRSRAVHGGLKDEERPLAETHKLMTRILLKIIEANSVPSRTDLEARLFGAS